MYLSGFLNLLKSKIAHAGYRVRGRKKSFKKIYKEGGFSGGNFPASGSGSSLEQTKTIRQAIPQMLRELNVKSLLDAPCGDFTWMREIDLGDIFYTGADVVDELVEKNNIKHAMKNRAFITADIVTDDLPKSDLVFCRDCFVHLSNRDTIRSIKNFKKSRSTYLLTTTFYDVSINKDIVSGRGWRPINLNIPPFVLAAPLKLIVEGCTEFDGAYFDKSLGLWKLSDISI